MSPSLSPTLTVPNGGTSKPKRPQPVSTRSDRDPTMPCDKRRPMTVEDLFPGGSVFSTISPARAHVASDPPARVWPSYSATLIHLPAHHDLRYQREREQAQAAPVRPGAGRRSPSPISLRPRSPTEGPAAQQEVAPAEREAEKEKKRSEETGDQEGSEASVDTPSVDTPCINIIPPEREREQERADPASEQPTVASKIAVVPARAAGFISSAAVAVTGHATPHPVPAPAPAPPSGPSSTSTTTPVPVPVPGATVTAAIPVPVPVPGATVTAATLAHTSTLDLLTNTLLSELARLREAEEAVGRLRGEIFAKTAELAAKEAERDERRERLGLYERSIAEALVGLQVETARLEELRARLPAD